MGIPEDLLLPVLPWNAGWPRRGGSDPNGKAPGRFVHGTGRWGGLSNWSHGCPPNDRRISDEWNCNAGLLLGQEVDGITFATLDGDLTDDSEGINRQFRDVLLRSLAKSFGTTGLMARTTVVPRFMILARIAPGGEVGGRQVIELEYRDPESGSTLTLGKLELLTRGEQAVIAGTHQSGTTISWANTLTPQRIYRAPKLDEGVPLVPDFPTLARLALEAVKPFERVNIFARIASAPSRALVGASRDPNDLAPISAKVLVELIDRMPNPTNLSRAHYINFWYALAGCRKALITLNRITNEDALEIIRAGQDWAARWVPPEGKKVASRAEEMAQFTWIASNPMLHLGWGYMKVLAIQCGTPEVGTESAKEDFTADLPFDHTKPQRRKTTNPDPDYRMPMSDVTPEQLAPTPENPKGLAVGFRAGPRTVHTGIDVPLADVQMADHLELLLSGELIWLTDEKRWLTYDAKCGWRGDDSAGSRVEIQVEELLRAYASKWADMGPAVGEKWTRGDRINALSTVRIGHVMKRLASRFSKNRSEIDKGTYILQTPEGAVDLRTGNGVTEVDQKALMDTRCTRFSIAPGETPLFDELIFNLSDGDPEVQNFFLHYLGYCLLGNPKARIFLFIWGTTGNGKSALIRVLTRIFGNYVVTLNKDVLLQRGKDMHKTDLYRIRGARIACVIEMPPNEKWDESLIKAITGGDEISARPMHANARSFMVEASLLMAGNTIPAFDRVDQAIAARVRITGTTFQPKTPDPTWEDRMVTGEAGGIIAKLGGYARAVFEAGIKLPDMPEKMLRQTRVYLGEQDTFYAWAAAELNTGHGHITDETPFMELKRRFEAFMKREAENGEGTLMTADRIGDKTFATSLRSLGLRLESEVDGQRFQRVIQVNGKNAKEWVVRGCSFKVRVVQAS